MTVAVQCQRCGQAFAAAPHLYGQRVACPMCQAPLQIPFPAVAPAAPPATVGGPYGACPEAPVFYQPSTPAVTTSDGEGSNRVVIVAAVIGGATLLILFLAILVSQMSSNDGTPPAAGGTAPSSSGSAPPAAAGRGQTFADARRGFQTKLTRRKSAQEPMPPPPPHLARLVQFDSPVGKLGAYLTNVPADGLRHPAIIWITGGDYRTIDAGVFEESPPNNDQTAGAFRKAGVVTMYPSLRGGNQNPGYQEGFFGEVDDVLAAAEFLSKQEGVDPQRLYLGGHSTGGTLVLLVSAATDRFRAVFPFGPVDDIRGYGTEDLPFRWRDARELELRTPSRWLESIQKPTFVFEGAREPGNVACLHSLSRASRNPQVRYFPVRGANHFNILAPLTRLIAAKILQDAGPTGNITFTDAELNLPFAP